MPTSRSEKVATSSGASAAAMHLRTRYFLISMVESSRRFRKHRRVGLVLASEYGTHSTSGSASARSHPAQRWVVYLSAVMAQSGIQLIAPGLPAVQAALGLDDSQISLVTSVYLLPSVFAALAGGVLAQKLGRRTVFAGSMLLFGAAGSLVPVLADVSFMGVLLARTVQGVGFAGILPMTITVIGDLFRGRAQVTVQGHRSVAMQLGDSAMPALGGILAASSWVYPFLAPVLALPLAAAIWRYVDDQETSPRGISTAATMTTMLRFAKDPALISIQVAGFVRFLLKFMVLTYVPILAVNELGMSVATIGVGIGAATLMGGVAAAFAGSMLRYAKFSRLINWSLLLYSLCLFGIAVSANTWLLMSMVLAYGIADGLYGVLQNGVAADAVEGEERAAFVYATGAVRNLGKFLAPVAVAGIALFGSVSHAFIVGGFVSLCAMVAARPLRRYDRSFAQDLSTT